MTCTQKKGAINVYFSYFFSLRLFAIVAHFLLPSYVSDRQLRRRINSFQHARRDIDASVTLCMNDCQKEQEKERKNERK